MNEYTSIRNQTCPNALCGCYGKNFEENVVSHSRAYARFKCTACGKTWAASRRSKCFGLKKDFAKVELALALARRGMSIRSIAREVSVSAGTVQRWKAKFK